MIFNSKKNICVMVCLAVFLGVSCSKPVNFPKSTIEITKQDGSPLSIHVEIAQTEEQKSQGFMNRKNIPDGTGMLFVYSKDLVMHFWMKNTPTPLSIAFIDSQGRIKEIVDMEAFSLETISSQYAVRYALEVPQGWFVRVGVEVGDSITVMPKL